ncbi:thioesterase II family protein [Streptomyces sp. NPDC002537]
MTDSPWIKRPRKLPDAAARLFLVPHGGAGPSALARWVPELAPDIEVCLVHLPGRESRRKEEPLDDLQAIADHVAEGMLPLLDRPFAFLGHSMGAIIAYETAHRLPEEPVHLFASASPPPHRMEDEPPVSHLPDAEFLAEVRRAYAGIPDSIWDDPDMMRIMLPALRADFHAYEHYRWPERPRLSCPVSAFGGTDDILVPTDSLAAWGDLTTGDCRVRKFDGGHFYLTDARAEVQRLVREEFGPVAAAVTGRA